MSSSGGQHVSEWQRSTPYLLASEDKDFQIKYTASCMCGEVQYAVDCDPVAAKYCHCSSCQKLHGKLTTSVHLRRRDSNITTCQLCICRSSISMGSSFSQEVSPLLEGCRQAYVFLQYRYDPKACSPMQSQLLKLPFADG